MAKLKNNKKTNNKKMVKTKASPKAKIKASPSGKAIKKPVKTLASVSPKSNGKTAQISIKDRAKQLATTLKQKEKAAEGRKRTNVSVPQPDDVKVALDRLLSNERAIEYLKKNVSKMAVDVIGMLTTPKTDEYLAEQLGTKINAIRRILNTMQGYGITNYYISKNTKGWLSFAWYINTSKLPPFLDYVDGMEREKSIVNEGCNDYFVCNTCYKTDRFVFTFDSAFENTFKCNNCGKNLNRMNREEAEVLLNKSSTK
jgi:transcription initiation factor IIE alpha subunit